MYFEHADEIWRDFPELVPGIVVATGITPEAKVADAVDRYTRIALDRLAVAPESEFPEIQAWRRAFARLGLKPTQYRCASEALLRRLRKEGGLPPRHPLVDLCNAISAAFATPVAVLDADRIGGDLRVRYATGDERYLTFAGEVEHPAPGEVIYADTAGQAHARRWTNRQSGASAVRDSTSAVLIVAEALHKSAPSDMPRLVAAITAELSAAWPGRRPAPASTIRTSLSRSSAVQPSFGAGSRTSFATPDRSRPSAAPCDRRYLPPPDGHVGYLKVFPACCTGRMCWAPQACRTGHIGISRAVREAGLRADRLSRVLTPPIRGGKYPR